MTEKTQEQLDSEILMHLTGLSPEAAITYIDSILKNPSNTSAKVIAFLKDTKNTTLMTLIDKAIILEDTDAAFNYYKLLGNLDRNSYFLIGKKYGALKKYLLAAQNFEKAKQLIDAAENYEKAAEKLDKAEYYLKAAKLYSQASAPFKKIVHVTKKAAQLYQKMGNYELAEYWYSNAGLKDKADKMRARIHRIKEPETNKSDSKVKKFLNFLKGKRRNK